MISKLYTFTDPNIDRQFQAIIQYLNKSVPVYADNASAVAGGLNVGDYYRTGGDPDQLCVVHG